MTEFIVSARDLERISSGVAFAELSTLQVKDLSKGYVLAHKTARRCLMCVTQLSIVLFSLPEVHYLKLLNFDA